MPPTLATPLTAQSMLDAAHGPGYTVTLAEPGNYGHLAFNHDRPCLLQGAPGATVKSLSWEGGPPRGNQQVKNVDFAGGGPGDTAFWGLDDVSNVLIENCTVTGPYYKAFGFERADKQWPQPRNIRIHGLRARGMVGIGGIIGATDSVTLDDLGMDCSACQGGNGLYLHDKQASNLRLKYVMVLGRAGLPACNIRGGGAENFCLIAEGGLVGFAAGHAAQSVRGCVCTDCTRYEFEIDGYGPLYAEGIRLSNSLPASALDGGGPNHHNVHISSTATSRIEIRDASALTVAPEAGTCLESSCLPPYGAVIELGMSQSRSGSPIEYGADVSGAYTFLDGPAAVANRTVADYCTERGLTLEQLLDTRVPVRDIYDWITEQ